MVLIHIEGSRKDNSPDAYGEGKVGANRSGSNLYLWMCETRQKWSGSAFGIRDKSGVWGQQRPR